MFPAWDPKPRTLQRKRLRRFVAVGKWRQIVWSLKKVKFASISIFLIEFSQKLGYGKMNLLSQPNDIITPSAHERMCCWGWNVIRDSTRAHTKPCFPVKHNILMWVYDFERRAVACNVLSYAFHPVPSPWELITCERSAKKRIRALK